MFGSDDQDCFADGHRYPEIVKGYRYRITVEPLEGPKGERIEQSSLVFEAVNHDEILGLVERRRQRGEFDRDTSASLMIGLKLFSEVMLQNKDKPLFSPLMPHFREFMKRLKSASTESSAEES
jgi:hypothetical protein